MSMTKSHFMDLYLHQEWADARIWKAVLASEKGRSDEYVLNTLMHIHETQQSFLNVWLDRPFERWKREEIGSVDDVCEWARQFYSSQTAFLESISDAELSRITVVPWAKYFARSLGHDPGETTLAETLHQVVSHSMHHRGQVARRLRELEGAPPLTDYIVWLWSGRPLPEWT